MYDVHNIPVPADEVATDDLVVYEEKLWNVKAVVHTSVAGGMTLISLVDAVGRTSVIRYWPDYKPAVTRVRVVQRKN